MSTRDAGRTGVQSDPAEERWGFDVRLERPSSVNPAPSGTYCRDWRGILLDYALKWQLDDSPEDLVDQLVEALAMALPHHAVGARVALRAGDAAYIAMRGGHNTADAQRPTPARLFPVAAHELVVQIGPPETLGTLHAATEAPEDRLTVETMLVHASTALEVALERTRTFQRVSTSVQRLLTRVAQTEKLASLGQLAAGFVHELNNPITSILAYTELLKRGAPDGAGDEVARGYLERISEAGHRMLRFARDLSRYSRPASGSSVPLTLTDPIEMALAFCEHEFHRYGVSVNRDFAPGLPRFQGVRDQLTQVFVNLFTNAAHAMSDQGGTLEVLAAMAPGGSLIEVRVRDQGVGMADATLDRIFEPFFTTKADGRGTGLGLSIVLDIIQAHGASIQAQHRSPRGTEFTLRFPAVPREDVSDSAPSQTQPAS